MTIGQPNQTNHQIKIITYTMPMYTDNNATVFSAGERRNFITHLSMDESGAHGDRTNLLESKDDSTNSQFLRHFLNTSGPPQVITLCFLLSLALGSTVAVVPAVVEDRYARLRHGYDGEASCLDIPKIDRPQECLFGNEDAQNAAAMSGFIHSTLTFATSSLIGSISDERGRVGE
jgi:hypothetical protein